MAPRDATMFWLSRRTANDMFLLYCFTETGSSTAELRAFVTARAATIPDLRIRLREIPGNLDYPRWERAEFTPQQFVAHGPGDAAWPTVLDRVGELLGTGVDATESPWRIHVFRGVRDVPTTAGPALVVVLQLSHALADGTRAAAIARSLFAADAEVVHRGPGMPVDNSADRPVGPVKTPARPVDSWGQICGWTTGTVLPGALGLLRFPQRVLATAWHGRAALRAQQEMARRTAAGEVPAATPGFAAGPLNPATPVGALDHRVRMLVLDRSALRVPGRTLTVVALTVISHALATYLDERGEAPSRLGSAVLMAVPTDGARNNFHSLSIDLHIEEPDLAARAGLIADDLASRRTRVLNPLRAAQDRVGASVPPLFAARDVARADLDSVPAAINGNTVVSSVYRGPADLAFAGAPVLFTGGFPALGTVMHLTHGLHGIGETITLSVHFDVAVLTDPERYLALLAAALDDVVGAH